MENKGWRVGHNFRGTEVSLDIGSLETFKKDPISSFAREIVQNSIDAKRDNEDKVIVQFKKFDLNKEDVPDYDTWANAFSNVLINWEQKQGKTKENDLKRMKEMIKISTDKIIPSMRVSDFNTSGLIGVNTKSESSQFYALTKGEGVSFKGGTAGGSKGIGKYASFVVSKLHTVFYSTITETYEKGYLGRALLPSGIYLDPNNNFKPDKTGLKTNGEWYYAESEYLKAINDQLILDKSFKRQEEETGTDLYILGFDFIDKWETHIIVKILESFIVAIVKGTLEVEVDNIIINSQTIEFLIDNLPVRKNTASYKNILAQHDLLTDDSVYHIPITIDEYGVVDLYVKSYSNEDKHLASGRCSIVRYPFMKIKDIKNIIQVPFSALAVINDDKINSTLRRFENPEHTDWLFNRNDYDKEERKVARELYNEVDKQIKLHINEYLLSSDKKTTDVEGAGEYLPHVIKDDLGLDKKTTKVEKIKIHKSKTRKNIDTVGYYESSDSNALNPDLGSLGTEDEFIDYSKQENSETKNKFDNLNINEGNELDYLNKKQLKGVRYNLLAVNPTKGEYIIRFIHNENLTNCDLKLYIVGDNLSANEKHPINIKNAKVNGIEKRTSNDTIYNFDIIKDKMNDIYIKTDQKESFSGRIVIYASR